MKTCVPLLVLLSSVAVGAVGGDLLTKDKEALQGRWVAVAVSENGKDYPEEKISKVHLTIKDDKEVFFVDGKSFTAAFKIAVNKKPKEMDIAFEGGPQKGKTMLAIYSLEGDSLKICGGIERPTEFNSPEESRVILMVFKRKK